MGQIEDQLNLLENKMLKLFKKHSILKQENQLLKQNLQEFQSNLTHTQDEVLHWKQQFETLKVANAMLGSDDNKRETKLKINALIREIDYCISQLSE
ncbi:hypothetical protein [Aurantibacter aestuarii]|uniref:Uncharacterized protein n=1 Tax=Aurantibacter aestuarii TaxID=1266046 RepID=A0A2T1N9P2_9FLAO|nr:hypothetical protein [Aurantibacter aestuarii]PSG88578.1 hypothetical protein C7H52_09805 [Aurantibacter aestuarii]